MTSPHPLASTPPDAPGPSRPGPGDLAALDDRLVAGVEHERRAVLAAHRDALAARVPESAQLVDLLDGYLEGGKLLRPRFCFWAGVAALGREPHAEETQALARLGTAIELVQAAALLHDDVIDHSATRRGRPALHVATAATHREQGYAGSAEDFGAAVAIVLGDLALTWAEQLAATVPGADVPDGPSARAEFEALRSEVMVGQYLDVLHQAGGFASPADPEQAALAVLRWKTVPYTVERPVRMGAVLAGADADLADRLGAWAIEVGTAFQLRDDLLGVIGEEESTGKPVDGDLREGKRTALLARTVAAADDAGRALLDRAVGDPGASAADLAAVRDLMVSTGAVRSVAADIRDRADRAARMLAGIDGLRGPGRAGLAALAERATDLTELPV